MLLALLAAVTVVNVEPSQEELKAVAVMAYTYGQCWHTDRLPYTDQRMRAQLPEPLYELYERGKADEKARPPGTQLTFAQCKELIKEVVDRLPKSQTP